MARYIFLLFKTARRKFPWATKFFQLMGGQSKVSRGKPEIVPRAALLIRYGNKNGKFRRVRYSSSQPLWRFNNAIGAFFMQMRHSAEKFDRGLIYGPRNRTFHESKERMLRGSIYSSWQNDSIFSFAITRIRGRKLKILFLRTKKFIVL